MNNYNLKYGDFNNIKIHLSTLAELKYPFMYNSYFEFAIIKKQFFERFLKKNNTMKGFMDLENAKGSSDNKKFLIIKVYSNPCKVFISDMKSVFEYGFYKIKFGKNYTFFNEIDDFNIVLFSDDNIKRIILSKINHIFFETFKYIVSVDKENWKLYNLGYYSYFINNDYCRNFLFHLNLVKDLRIFNNIIVTWNIKCKDNVTKQKISIQYCPPFTLDYINLYDFFYDNSTEEKIKEVRNDDEKWKEVLHIYNSTIERMKRINFEEFDYPKSIIFKEWEHQVSKYKEKLDIEFLKNPKYSLMDFIVKHRYKNTIFEDDICYISKEKNDDFSL